MKLIGIQKRYGDNTVLSDISLDFSEGEVTMLSGVSGRGKTTLLRIMMGLEKADSGSIENAPKRISAVFQEDRLPLEFSAEKCVRMTGAPSISKAYIDKELETIGLGEHNNKPVRELSGGMRRRVAIVRAMCAEFDTLFLDEPFTGLDAETKRIAAEYILERRKGRTVILVSHSDEDAALLGARTIRI